MPDLSVLADKWLIVRIFGLPCGIAIDHVRELMSINDRPIVALPGYGPDLVGVLRLRDRVIPVVDLRTVLGFPSMAEENRGLLGLLTERERDHVNWITELEACVAENRPFRLATDPHACKFGKWYDALMGDEATLLRTTNGDRTLERHFRQIDGPHQRIHGIAQAVAAAVDGGRAEEGRVLIERTRSTDLAAIVNLFTEMRRCIAEVRRPQIVVLERGERHIGALVDAVDAVQEIPADEIEPAGDDQLDSADISGFTRRIEEASGKVISLLRTEAIFNRLGVPVLS
ncbi:MAG TPA: chemotaxis protein CheW [Phycisphaerae bacterium]|nr:chemotaxis protein CheW [Phycisphaerae bacterium]